MVSNFLNRVQSFIDQEQLFASASTVVVAVSGGLDSVALLRVLHAYSLHHPIRLIVAHLNHNLRGDASLQDARFVKNLAKELGLDYVSEALEVPVDILSENHLRQCRYDFLRRVAEEYQAQCIAVGHHRDDQIETFWMRLIRGSLLQGLKGMDAQRFLDDDCSIKLIRPLLTEARQDIHDWVVDHGWAWREDASNGQLHYLRNRVRHQLLPLLSIYQPNIKDHVEDLTSYVKQLYHDMAQEVAVHESTMIARGYGGWILSLEPWKKLSITLQYEVLFRLMQRIPGKAREINKVHVDELCKVCHSDKAHVECRVVRGVECVKSYHQLWIGSDASLLETSFAAYGTNLEVCEKECTSAQDWRKAKDNHLEIVVDQAKVVGGLELTICADDDAFVPLGLSSLKIIKDFCSDHKIPYWQRKNLQVVRDQEKIIWLCGYRMDERVKCDDQTKKELHLRLNVT